MAVLLSASQTYAYSNNRLKGLTYLAQPDNKIGKS